MNIVRLVLVALILSACSAAAPPAPREVVYTVEGSSLVTVGLTMRNDTGGNEQRDHKLPYRHALTVEPGAFLYISARIRTDLAGARIVCRITVDGEVIAEAEAVGFPHGATCSARAP